MAVTKPYEFIGFGAMDVTKPYKSIGFGAKAGRRAVALVVVGVGFRYGRQRRCDRTAPKLGHALFCGLPGFSACFCGVVSVPGCGVVKL